jgi:hypothetical protein
MHRLLTWDIPDRIRNGTSAHRSVVWSGLVWCGLSNDGAQPWYFRFWTHISNIRGPVVTLLSLHRLSSVLIIKEGKADTVWRSLHSAEIFTKCGDRHKVWRSSHSVEIITQYGDHTAWRSSQSVEVITKCEDSHTVWRSSQSVEIITQFGHHHTVWRSSDSVIITKCGDHHTVWRSSQSLEIITQCGDRHKVWRSSHSLEIITQCGDHHKVWRSSQSVEIITQCGDHHTFRIAYRQSWIHFSNLWSLSWKRTLQLVRCTTEHHRWWVFGDGVQRGVLGSERKEVTWGRIVRNIHDSFPGQPLPAISNQGEGRWVGYVAGVRKTA